MARMPGAVWLGEHSPRRPMERYDIVCVHTIVGFAPAHAAHFSIHSGGRIDQSRDTRYQSAANLHGNPRVIANENEDGARDVPLTPEQIESNAQILAWAHRVHGVPLQLCPNSRPGSRGLAYHRQGVNGNFGGFRFPGRVSGGEVWSRVFGKTCPRDKRIAQLPLILERAKQLVNREDDDMPYNEWPDADKKALARDVANAVHNEPYELDGKTHSYRRKVEALFARAKNTEQIVRQLLRGDGDPK